MTISQEHVRRLIDADADDAVLVLLEGRAQVLSAADPDSPDNRGAMTVAAKADLVDESGSLSRRGW